MKTVSSRQNPLVREFRSLADAPDPEGLRLLLDGAHLVREARRPRVALEVVAVATSRLERDTEEGALARALAGEGVDVVQAGDRIFTAMSPVKTPSGIVAIGRRSAATIEELCGRDAAFVLTVVNVQDPGNVGALIRVAEAGGVTGALICGSSANPFSWKALRGSMGSALRLPIVFGLAPDAAVRSMKHFGLHVVAATPRNGLDPDAVNWRGRVALLLGGEGAGLDDGLVEASAERVSIGMAAAVESLNVAAAGAVLVYAARRQRLLQT